VLLASSVRGLETASRTRPLLLVVEDLQWTDLPSLTLLRTVRVAAASDCARACMNPMVGPAGTGQGRSRRTFRACSATRALSQSPVQ